MARLDIKWKSVRPRLFDPEKFKAHNQFYTTIAKLAKSKTELNKLLEQNGYVFHDELEDANQTDSLKG